MPRPVDASTTYLPGLDGIRAIAVAAVVAYHVDVPWLPGGLLGVAVFFTLSGYLITGLLLKSLDRHGDLELRTFWLRRARRLLPAVVIMLGVVWGVSRVLTPDDMARRGKEVLAALFYVSNWYVIGSDQSYFDRFATPSPLDHLWSLAVEEQFYVVWPLLLTLLLVVLRWRPGRVLLLTLGLAVASSLLMWLLYQPGFDNTRAYEGTDTRAAGLLFGAAAAMMWRPGWLNDTGPTKARHILDLVGLGSFVVLMAQLMFMGDYSPFLYRGGIVVLSLATCGLIAAAVHPSSWTRRALSLPPLVWVGARSYGIYLWHLPVVTFLPRDLLSDHPVVRGVLVAGITLALAALSWRWVEEPVRTLGFRRALLPGKYRMRRRTVLVSAGALAAVASVALAVPAAAAHLFPETTSATASGAAASGSSGGSGGTTKGPAPAATTLPPGALRTRCTEVVQIGDSTSLGFIRADYTPKAENRMEKRYAAVGVQQAHSEIAAARSVVERVGGVPNGQEVAKSWIDRGYAGCFIVALGLNEAANVAVGSNVSVEQRIDRMMQTIGDHPVLWPTVATAKDRGPYANTGMQAFDEALVAACAKYPNLRVYDWAAQVKPQWYIPDQTHQNMTGYPVRIAQFARALALAFPAEGDSPASCVVTPPLPNPLPTP